MANLAKTTNYFGLSWSLGLIIGTFIGRYLQHHFAWQADFYFFVVYGAIIYLFILLQVP